MKKLTAILGLMIGGLTVFSAGAFGISWLFINLDKGYHVALGTISFLGFLALIFCVGFIYAWIDNYVK